MHNRVDDVLQKFIDSVSSVFLDFLIPIVAKYYKIYILGLFLIFMLPTILGISSGVHEYYAKFLKWLFILVNDIISKTNGLKTSSDKNNSYNDTSNPEKHFSEYSDFYKVNKSTQDFHIPSEPKEFQILDICPFLKSGINAIINDNVMKRFTSEELDLWNMLKRSQPEYYSETVFLNLTWWFGFLFRYFILLPNRLILFGITASFITIMASFVYFLPNNKVGNKIGNIICVIICRMAISALSVKVKVHGRENIAKNGVCVANHTTPIDAIILSSQQFFTLVGQKQGGFLGRMQNFFIRTGHIFFERSIGLDRISVSNHLKEHAEDTSKPPIILFPEGTCINNTSVMLFRKGTFEITNKVHPVAIKYESVYGDAFWNSQEFGFFMYLIYVMSSWMIYCNIWFLPPIEQLEQESTIDFAVRTRHAIATKANLQELDWDGNLKRSFVPPRFKANLQNNFSKKILLPKDPNFQYKQNLKKFDQIVKHSFSTHDISHINRHLSSAQYKDDIKIGSRRQKSIQANPNSE